ncbi:MAG: hypothetical protein RIB45_17845 [Marivibrio sp.]|uniref:hypothetical protein n=1 Tax=Marivibrio sp. TaxID=2039719 RepID=UPI0032EB69CD
MKKLLAPLAFAGLAAAALLVPIDRAQADTPNLGVATPGVVLMPIQLSGQVGANVTGAATFQLPFKAKILGVTATARASGGTSPTLAIEVLDDGTTVLTAPIAVTAGTVSEGALAAPVVADESEISIDLDLGGTSPTWDDVSILITLVRL